MIFLQALLFGIGVTTLGYAVLAGLMGEGTALTAAFISIAAFMGVKAGE